MLQRVARGAVEPHDERVRGALVQRVAPELKVAASASGQDPAVPGHFQCGFTRSRGAGDREPSPHAGDRFVEQGARIGGRLALGAPESEPELARFSRPEQKLAAQREHRLNGVVRDHLGRRAAERLEQELGGRAKGLPLVRDEDLGGSDASRLALGSIDDRIGRRLANLLPLEEAQEPRRSCQRSS